MGDVFSSEARIFRAGVHPLPPVFPDTLPVPLLAFRNRLWVGGLPGERIVVDAVIPQPPLIDRDCNRGSSRERLVRDTGERGHVRVRRLAADETENEQCWAKGDRMVVNQSLT